MIVTLMLNAEPTQVLDGVTLYTAVTGALVVFISVPLTLLWPDALAPPVKPLPEGVLHAYVVPDGTILPVGVYVNGTPPQVEVLWLENTGVGRTVTVTVKDDPAHPPAAVGVTL